MNEEYITRKEHDLFAEKIEAENDRQNHRISSIEEELKTLLQLNISVAQMAESLKQMAKELEKQGYRLEQIEKEPAENWKKAIWLVLSALIGAAVGAFLRGGIPA